MSIFQHHPLVSAVLEHNSIHIAANICRRSHLLCLCPFTLALAS
ncbi:hypothetical protein [Vibrio gallaecicus]|nr:hypothetical protein [Vibrio gallaecicus]MDN3614991.1 hypothetical protein [Vibrio gallaecicus]